MLFVSVLLHELGHSVVALRYGIPVRSIAFAWNPQTSVLLGSQVRARKRFGEAREKNFGIHAACRT